MKKCWKCLVDTKQDYLKRIKESQKSGSGFTQMKTWEFGHLMSFLHEYNQSNMSVEYTQFMYQAGMDINIWANLATSTCFVLIVGVFFNHVTIDISAP